MLEWVFHRHAGLVDWQWYGTVCLTGIVDCWIDRSTGMKWFIRLLDKVFDRDAGLCVWQGGFIDWLPEIRDEGFDRDAKVRVIMGSLIHRDVAVSIKQGCWIKFETGMLDWVLQMDAGFSVCKGALYEESASNAWLTVQHWLDWFFD